MNDENKNLYLNRALNVRKRMLIVGEKCDEQIHWGGALSSIEIMTYLAFEHIQNDDFVVMSKGHAALAVYSAFEEARLIPEGSCMSFQENGGFYTEELEYNREIGINCSTGSLGLGLSFCVGKAIRYKRENDSRTVFCVVGDGECDEGSIWEATMLAAQQNLDNLILIIDCNGLQLCGPTKDIISMEGLEHRFESFGWKSVVINGHDFCEIENAIKTKHDTHPLAIIANTVKGKGISFMENNPIWHDRKMNASEIKQVKEELRIKE